MTGHDKLVQYLNEAHATETTLIQTLTAHIGVTPAGPYRDLLERHLRETREQARTIEDRLREIGAGRSPVAVGIGLLEAVAGQALALGKAPLDLLRGSGGEEKLLKNAKDEAATEALEIATYDALEALAGAVGDEVTAALARRHREQEEAMLAGLRALIPALTAAVVASDVEGEGVYDASSTGAADAARKVANRS
jgi:ferritin-like metal-binding protein YciE